MRSDPEGAHVGFDPIGLRVMPGTVVRWVVEANVHTATAYHPVNGGHPLRIPEQAEPWDSNYLVEPGQAFEVMLTARASTITFDAARGGRHGRSDHRRSAGRSGHPIAGR